VNYKLGLWLRLLKSCNGSSAGTLLASQIKDLLQIAGVSAARDVSKMSAIAIAEAL
jgi:hypothetical protein